MSDFSIPPYVSILKERFGEDIQVESDGRKIKFQGQIADPLFSLLHSNSQFRFLELITCVQRSAEHFELIYQFLCNGFKERMFFQVLIKNKREMVFSLGSLWPIAVYYEREIHEMFGLCFDSALSNSKLLLTDEQSHPLLKEPSAWN